MDCVGAFLFVKKLDGDAGTLAFLQLQSLVLKPFPQHMNFPKPVLVLKALESN